jgi:hypothetical protein
MNSKEIVQNLIIFGGIGSIAYLLFKKQKTDTAKFDIKYTEENGQPSSRKFDIKNTLYRGLSLQNICANTASGTKTAKINDVLITEEELPYISSFCNKLKTDNTISEIDQPLIDFPSKGYANTCRDLDVEISRYDDRIIDDNKYNRPSWELKYDINRRDSSQAMFDKFRCRDKIETERTKDLIGLELKGSINAEKSILNKNFEEQNTYIIFGGLVLLTSFYVLLKK